MPAFDSRCSAAAAYCQVVVSPPLPFPHLRPLHRPPPPRPRRRPGTLRYDCLPPPQFHLLLKSWLRQHRKASSSLILSEMKSIGYTPDCGTCNYLFLTLSKIGQFVVSPPLPHPRPLHRPPPPHPRRRPGTLRYDCLPRRSSTTSSQIVAAATPEGVYGGLIVELSEARKVDAVAEVVREMM
ncbi:hypothetical protein SASPL_135474 [Salvia splendens]|uniref:Uncharacterized protein n=1 Tax=Salvia splendens TaxID=180675 RepID=A0A8X8ZFI3_SALSN|nr:hypothetical protein SASPL_135474 [Salvia splendens]